MLYLSGRMLVLGRRVPNLGESILNLGIWTTSRGGVGGSFVSFGLFEELEFG